MRLAPDHPVSVNVAGGRAAGRRQLAGDRAGNHSGRYQHQADRAHRPDRVDLPPVSAGLCAETRVACVLETSSEAARQRLQTTAMVLPAVGRHALRRCQDRLQDRLHILRDAGGRPIVSYQVSDFAPRNVSETWLAPCAAGASSTGTRRPASSATVFWTRCV